MANVTLEEIEALEMIGGTTRIPMSRTLGEGKLDLSVYLIKAMRAWHLVPDFTV